MANLFHVHDHRAHLYFLYSFSVTLTFRTNLHDSAFGARPVTGLTLNLPFNTLRMRLSLVKIFKFDTDGHFDRRSFPLAASLPLLQLINTIMIIYLLAIVVQEDFLRPYDVFESFVDSFVSLILLFLRVELSALFLDGFEDCTP